MKLKILIFTLLCILVNGTDRYLFSNFDLKPDFVILNSTSISKILCTKQIDDNQGFEISTMPIISSNNLLIHEHLLNKTTLEITIQSFNYIGVFNLICSAIGDQSAGIRSDIIIGSSPGVFKHIQPCTVYENTYVDCIIRAPTMVSAIDNKYPYHFDYTEIHQSLIPNNNVYNQPPELIKIDSLNGTITFRWYPIENGIFPSRLKILITGRLRYFGSTNLTIDMTPNFLIKPNFTIENLSSTYFQVHFNHDKFSTPLFCRGNLTNNAKSKHNEDYRIFRENNPGIIPITHLTPNTWYQLCFQCRQIGPVNSISEVQCIRKQTKQFINWLRYLIIYSIVIFSSIIIILIIYAISRSNNCIKVQIIKCKKPRDDSDYRNQRDTPEIEIIVIESQTPTPSELINIASMPLITKNDLNSETTASVIESPVEGENR